MNPFIRSQVKFILSLLVISSACLVLLISTKGGAHAASPSIKFYVKSSPPTSSVKMSGSGFGASEKITIDFDTAQVGTATTDSNGNVSATITIPSSALPGKHNVQATGLISGLSAQTVFLVQTNWNIFGFNQHNTRFNLYENELKSSNVSSLVLDWTASMGGDVSGSPAVNNGVVYVGAYDGKVYAFNASGCQGSSCLPLWTGTTGGHALSSPAVTNNMVYIVSDDSKLYAFNASGCQGSSCLPLWTAATNGYVPSTPTVVNNVVYVGTNPNTGASGNLYAFNAKTGIPLWIAATNGRIRSSPAIVNGVVYVGSDGTLYAFDAKTGTNLWTASLNLAQYAFLSSPAVANGTIYIGSDNGNFYALKASGCQSSSCSPLWVATTPGVFYSSPAIANGVIYASSGDDNLYVFNAKSGVILWTALLRSGNISGGYISSSPVVANGVVYVGSDIDENNLYAFNASGCQLTLCPPLWTGTFNDNSHTYSSPVVVNGIVYIVLGDGKLYTFHLPGTTS